jgi:hypothetical protein
MTRGDAVFFGFAAVFLALFWLMMQEVRHRVADHLDRFADDALQRGWRFSTTYTARGYYRTDWWESPSGAWTAESLGPAGPRSWDPRMVRWWNAGRDAAAPSRPLLVLLDADGDVLADLATREGHLARFAARRRFARAFARRFGEVLRLDGRTLQRVDGLGPRADGFVVLSDQPAEAARRLTPALLATIRQVWCAWADIGVERVWLGLCGDRIAIACVAARPAGVVQVAALVEAGTALAGART